MQLSQIAVQLFTLRDLLGSVGQIADTLQRVKTIGYSAVEVAAIDFAQLPVAELKQLLDGAGLGACALHGNPERMLDQPAVELEYASQLGVDYLVYPYPAGIDTNNAADISRLLDGLRRCAELAAGHGVAIAYHHHHHEFKQASGKLLIDTIFSELEQVGGVAELDTYWVQYGGGDPVGWCRKMSGRLPLLHLKDYRINAGNEVEFAEVGQGNLDMQEIISAAGSSGCRWYIVEQDECQGDPLVAISHSFRFLSGLCD